MVLAGLGALIVILSIVAIFDLLPSLRIVPDDTKFDFTRFRRISFPISALLSILAIVLFFTHGLNFGIDFKGGTLLEVQAKSGTADISAMRSTLAALQLGDVQLQQFGGAADVLIRLAEQPGGDAAQQAAVQKVRAALGDSVEYRRVEVVGPRVSGELLAYGMLGLIVAMKRLRRTDESAYRILLLWIVLLAAAALANGFLGGAISEPQSRYQSRMAWLLPFLSCIAVAKAYDIERKLGKLFDSALARRSGSSELRA